MRCNAFWMLKSVVTVHNTIQIATLQVCIWAEHAGVGVSQQAAKIIGIRQQKDGLTMQKKGNKLRERVWEIAQLISISNRIGDGPE